MTSRARRQLRPAGFTLVELLVVVGIVAVLIAALLPTLGRARASAESLKCLSNLRQMGQAAFAYAATHRGYFPPAQWGGRAWDFAWEEGAGGGGYVPGLLWEGRGAIAVQQCPGFDGRSNAGNEPFTGYNYNTSYIGRGENEGPPVKMVRVRTPSETALFGDGEWRLGANKYMRSPLPSPTEDPFGMALDGPGRAAGTQGYRHGPRSSRHTNVCFADGHAASIRERHVRAFVAPGTGFLSADNRLYDLE